MTGPNVAPTAPMVAGKLRFGVHACSGEDPDYPARELLYHSAHTRGWQTPRFCRYPQEVVLRLDRPARVQQIQILSHEYKITQRLEIFVGVPPPGETDPERCSFRRLGHLSFHTNERTNYQARELKTVHINDPAVLIKFVVNGPHVNQHNVYNQVCIIAINLLGEPLPAPAPGAAPGVPGVGAIDAAARDFALEMNVDSVTAAQIRELAAEKARAIAEEDYDRAKELKGAMDRLREVGRKVAQLEAKKRAAVEREDYDEAKALKEDIDKLRAGGVVASVPRHAREAGGDVLTRLAGAPPPAPGGAPPADFDETPVGAGAGGAAQGYGLPEEGGYPAEEDEDGRQMRRALSSNGNGDAAGRGKGPLSAKEYDERPAVGRGAYAPGENGAEEATPAAPARSRQPKPPGFADDLPDPEPLGQADLADAQQLIDMSSEYVAQCAYSKQHRLREAALQVLEKELLDNKLKGNPKDVFRTLAKAACTGMRDKIANVFMAGVSLLRSGVSEMAARVGGKDVAAGCLEAVPLLVEKAEDNNTRIRTTACEMLHLLANQPEIGMAPMERTLCRKVKNQSAVKPVLYRLTLVRDLLLAHGVSHDGQAGFSVDVVMAFAGPALNSPSADVRKLAVEVVAEVSARAGGGVQEYLPADLNPKIQEELNAALKGASGGAGRAARQPPAPKRAPAPPAPGRGPGPMPGRGGASPGRGPGPAPGRGGPPPGRGPGRGSPGPGRGGPGAGAGRGGPPGGGPGGPPPPRRQDAAPPAPEASDDPAVYERELQAKERKFGPNHEEVAEACSNLAILYNQNGDYKRALPLYERALRIWEKTKGPECADVAHTLTDLAVLYLEQGDDDRGRPLLERALRIQERELGPDHPDVKAIRDVLQSED